MTNRKKVVDDLLDFVVDLSPYCGNHADWMKVHAAVQALSPMKPKEYDQKICDLKYVCGECGHGVYRNFNFCPNCGREMKWE